MRAVRTGKRRKKSRKDQKPESALPLGAGGRNAVERTALSGERFIVLGAVGPAADVLRRAPQQKDRDREHHQKRNSAEREKADAPAEGADDRIAERIAEPPDDPRERRRKADGKAAFFMEPVAENVRRGVKHEKRAGKALKGSGNVKGGKRPEKAHGEHRAGKHERRAAEQNARIDAAEERSDKRQNNTRTDAEKEHIKSESTHTEAKIFDHGGIENAAAVVNDAERSALQQTTADQHPPRAVDAAGVVHIISLLYPVISFKKYIVK